MDFNNQLVYYYKLGGSPEMKRLILIIILSVILLSSLYAHEYSSWSMYLELDIYFAIKVGLEYRFIENIGICGSIGLCIAAPTQIDYNLFFIYHIMKFGNPFQIDIEAGLLQCAFDVISPLLPLEEPVEPYTVWNPGLALSLRYQHKKSFQIGLRVGGEIMLGYDLGKWRDPMLMPNIALEYFLPL